MARRRKLEDFRSVPYSDRKMDMIERSFAYISTRVYTR